MQIKTPPIFNPEGSDRLEDRKIWLGEPTGILEMNSVKYSWATELLKLMREHYWEINSYPLTEDAIAYKQLEKPYQRLYTKTLSWLTALDSLQASGLPNINRYVTAPEVKACVDAQVFFESGIHVASYQQMIESVIPYNDRSNIYQAITDDPMLKQRTVFVTSMYQRFIDEPTGENLVYATIGDLITESLLFWHGFMNFFLLQFKNTMVQTAAHIRLIQRDEADHIGLWQHLAKSAIKEFNRQVSRDCIGEMIYQATESEIAWNKYVALGDSVPVIGITEQSIEEYCWYRANKLLKTLQLDNYISKPSNNPYLHLEKLGNLDGDAMVKTNYLEQAETAYIKPETAINWTIR